jgi:hypothetical protein
MLQPFLFARLAALGVDPETGLGTVDSEAEKDRDGLQIAVDVAAAYAPCVPVPPVHLDALQF